MGGGIASPSRPEAMQLSAVGDQGGFSNRSGRLESASGNMPSAIDNPSPVNQYLQTEQQAQRILGPFLPQSCQGVHVSRFGVIPKRHKPGKWGSSSIYHHLWMSWGGRVFIDACLPFGLRSAPKIFCTISDTLEWILWKRCLHYLDDFLTMGAASSGECRHNLQSLVDICKELGLPLAEKKVEGPTTVLEQFNSTNMTMSLPPEKLARIS